MKDETAIPETTREAREQEPERDQDQGLDRDLELDEEQPETPRPAIPTQHAKARRRGLLPLAGLVLLALLGTLFAPGVRTVLRQSFTRMPQATTAIYFTADPTIRGAVLNVPITVDGTDTGTSTYQVKVWTETAAGTVDASTQAKVPTVKGVTAAVVTLTVAPDAAVVWASLDGTGQVIHFRIT